MPKLKFEFAAEIPLKESPSDIVALTALFPRPGQRAVAFGWLTRHADGPLAGERYWFADIGPDGVSHRVLPAATTERLVELTGRRGGTDGSDMWIVAFAFRAGVGLLLGTNEVHLYESSTADPVVLPIGNDFAAVYPGIPRGRFFPLFCGHARGNVVPVVLRSPRDGHGEGRHASALAIDADARQARWTTIDANGEPPALAGADYAGFPLLPSATGLAGSRPPMILDCALADDGWRVYAGGFSAAYHRMGLAPSVLGENAPGLALKRAVFQAKEESFGRLCASRDRLILTPLRKNGAAKGKQTIHRLDDGTGLPVTLPRGFTKHSIVEYSDGCYWLLPMPWRYAYQPLVACSEIA